MTPQQIKSHVNAFRIWREGNAVAWDCSIPELSEATGIRYDTVRLIVKRRKWPVRNDHSKSEKQVRTLAHRFAIDHGIDALDRRVKGLM